jgi:hypothetical protein
MISLRQTHKERKPGRRQKRKKRRDQHDIAVSFARATIDITAIRRELRDMNLEGRDNGAIGDSRYQATAQ